MSTPSHSAAAPDTPHVGHIAQLCDTTPPTATGIRRLSPPPLPAILSLYPSFPRRLCATIEPFQAADAPGEVESGRGRNRRPARETNPPHLTRNEVPAQLGRPRRHMERHRKETNLEKYSTVTTVIDRLSGHGHLVADLIFARSELHDTDPGAFAHPRPRSRTENKGGRHPFPPSSQHEYGERPLFS